MLDGVTIGIEQADTYRHTSLAYDRSGEITTRGAWSKLSNAWHS